MSRPRSARALAHDILVRVDSSAAFADVLLAEALAAGTLAADDARLLTQLVYGTLAWQGRLDHHLGNLLRRPLGRLEVEVRAALRLGLYQILFLERVPDYAAIDTSVSLAGRHGGVRGLVNAVLRRAAAAPHALPLPPAADRIRRLAVEWSHPVWLVEHWARDLQADDLVALLRADNEPPPTALRVNPLRATADQCMAELANAGFEARRGTWASSALVVERGGGGIQAHPAFREGRLSFQSEASQMVIDLLAPRRGMRVLDACAAPGGKSTAVAERLAGSGIVVALDPRPGGLARLARETARLGVSVRGVAGDARLPPVRGGFDAVLVDAPCSGLGTLRRHPELRWRREPQDVPRLAALQRAILDQVAPLVRPGGVVVYAVCTLMREENEDVVDDFVARHPGFGVEPASELPPHAASEAVDRRGFLRTMPSRHGVDGFFAARLRAGT